MNSTQDSTATQKSLFARYQEHITSAIFIGLVLGILTGLFLASRFDVVLTVTTLLGSMGVSDKITSIAIPLGATVNMDAVSIVLSFMIVFFANACGVEVSTSMMIVILLANVILSVGTPGIPGGAIASFAALATMAGLPAGVMGVYISINTLCDMGATCVNVIGDMAGCVVLKEKIKLDD